MALKQLTQEQIRDWTPAQKDQWWLDNVYRGNLPQLTLRSALTGFVLGAVLSLTNLYVGAKTGWTLGVGITSVILTFAMFRTMSRLGIAKDITILENNCSQSIATSAGYMTAPLVSSLAAYMMVTGEIIPMWQTYIWLISIAFLGVLFAFPMKRRFINDEQHPFPEGKAAGVVMHTLHEGDAREGVVQAKLLVITGGLSALISLLKSAAILNYLKVGFLKFPDHFETFIYNMGMKPAIGGITLKQLTIRPETDFVMMAAGGLMGIRAATSLLVGAIVSYVILAPIIINAGDISMVMDGDVPKLDSWGDVTYGFKSITLWGLWTGVSLMTTASLLSFFSKPKVLITAFKGIGRKRSAKEDVVVDIELPMKIFLLGIPVAGTLTVILAHAFFGVPYLMGVIAVPLVFVFTLIGVNSTALTSITPTGALGKLTQLTYGVLAPGNINTNLMTAGITAEVASNASNLLMDIKPGYMLGAKPRQQALGHCIGIFAGAMLSVWVFYEVFLKGDPAGLGTQDFPMPAAITWRAVAEVLTQGLDQLPMSARYGALFGGLMGIVLETLRIVTRGRFWLSPVGVGLAFVIPFTTCFAMWLGAFLFWFAAKRRPKLRNPEDPIQVKNQEPICAGVIAGGALMGITAIIIENLVLPSN